MRAFFCDVLVARAKKGVFLDARLKWCLKDARAIKNCIIKNAHFLKRAFLKTRVS
jgi:hypothetical protein